MIRFVIAYEAHVVAPVVLSKRSAEASLKGYLAQRLPSNFTNRVQLNVSLVLVKHLEFGLDGGLRLGGLMLLRFGLINESSQRLTAKVHAGSKYEVVVMM
jgi:hypothetical protein